MKKFNLIKTRDGHRSGTVQSYFFGESIDDKNMIEEAEDYLRLWLQEYNNSLQQEEEDELFDGFDGSFRYDVWSFELEEEEEEEEEEE